MKYTNDKIYQLKIVLKESNPEVWRRVLVPANVLLPDLHKIIQTTMGWENSHLHKFRKDNFMYMNMLPEIELIEAVAIVYDDIRLSDVLTKEKDKIEYQYDFGDNWKHEITLEKFLPVDEGIQYPLCIDGKMNCPPDDSGGVRGYMNMLQILEDPNHPDYEMFRVWLGDDFDPEFFNKHIVNELLRQKDYGCIEEW